MKKRILVVAAVLFTGALQAQTEAIKNLDEVIVTATKSEIKQSQTGKVVTVIDAATIQRNIGKSLTELLNTQAGIFIAGANNAPGSNQELYLRGAATANTLVMIDGIPVQDPSQINNTTDLNNINLTQIERIEILKGAQSTLWGSNAVAGVVNIITKKGGEKKIQPSAMLAYGSYNTLKAGAGVKGNLQRFNYNLLFNHTRSKGFSAAHDSTGNKGFDDDGIRQNNFQANIGYRISPVLSVQYTGSYGQYTADADAGAFTDEKDTRSTSENLLNNIHFTFKKNNTTLHLLQSLLHSNRSFSDDSASIGGFAKWTNSSYNGVSAVTDLYGNFYFTPHISLTGGVQYIAQHTDQEYNSISSYGPYHTALGKDSAKANNFSVYSSLLFLNINGFNSEFGFRYNYHNIYGSNGTFTINPSYNIDDNTKVFINISSGYRTPGLYELYSEYGNKELKPESSMNYEIGLQLLANENKSSVRLVGFRRDIKNLIIYYTNANRKSSYINRDKQNDYGFELESNIALGRNSSWVNNLTYIDGETKSENTKMKNLFRRPNFTFNSALNLQPAEGLQVTPSFRFVGNRLKGLYDAGPNPIPHYYTLDLYASYAFIKQARVFLDLRNITNQLYFDVPGYNSRRFNFMAGIYMNL